MLGLTLCVLPMYLQAATGQDLKPVYQPAQGQSTRSAEPIPAGTILPVRLNTALRSEQDRKRNYHNRDGDAGRGAGQGRNIA